MAAFQLQPLPHQIGHFDQFVARQSEMIALKERILSLSGDSFSITLANGQPILNVKGKLFTIGSRKSVFDMAGNHLFDIYRELLHLHTTYVLEDPQGNKFFEMKNKIKIFGSEATAKFTSKSGKQESLTMKGNWLDLRGEILDDSTGAIVAQIDRKVLNSRNLLFGQDTYGVVVAPGMDMSIIAAMCICLDDKNNER